LTGCLARSAIRAGRPVMGALAEARIGALAFVANIGIFWLALRLATAAEVSWRALRLGAILSAVSWQVLELLGTFLVGHTLRNSSELYGVFGVVLGLLTWLYVQALVTISAVEACTVREWRPWAPAPGPPPPPPERRAPRRP